MPNDLHLVGSIPYDTVEDVFRNFGADRMAVARKYLPDFGVAAYCGMGRIPQDELQNVLDDHLRAATGT